MIWDLVITDGNAKKKAESIDPAFYQLKLDDQFTS